ncbi:MAG: ribonuclease PH [Oscillospiraceae bacterium]|nr:ribonuclease PH [Oscillospiraceae bacterium]
MRIDGRQKNELRKIHIIRSFTKYALGSVFIEQGDTKVVCTVMIEDKVPPFLKGSQEGWLTAEYNMLPSSTIMRKQRDISKGKIDGRSTEIQRLIGRALRSVIDLKVIGEKTIWIDCDVIQADGGTRCASIIGSFIALVDAINNLDHTNHFEVYPVKNFVSAVSVGIVGNQIYLDLNYYEDSKANVDMNIVMTDDDSIIEIQGTGEERPFTILEKDRLFELALEGTKDIILLERDLLGKDAIRIGENKGYIGNKQ